MPNVSPEAGRIDVYKRQDLMSPLNFTHILTQAVDELSESESYKGDVYKRQE